MLWRRIPWAGIFDLPRSPKQMLNNCRWKMAMWVFWVQKYFTTFPVDIAESAFEAPFFLLELHERPLFPVPACVLCTLCTIILAPLSSTSGDMKGSSLTVFWTCVPVYIYFMQTPFQSLHFFLLSDLLSSVLFFVPQPLPLKILPYSGRIYSVFSNGCPWEWIPLLLARDQTFYEKHHVTRSEKWSPIGGTLRCVVSL